VEIHGKDQAEHGGRVFKIYKSGAKIAKIADLFGVKEPAVAAASQRLGLWLDDDEILRDMVEQIRGLLKCGE
jgi:hypothetical protein